MSATYGAIAQDNLRLANENMLLRAMEDNRRLAHENMVLRMQTQARAPPGLQSRGPAGWPQVPPWQYAQPLPAGLLPSPVSDSFAKASPESRLLFPPRPSLSSVSTREQSIEPSDAEHESLKENCQSADAANAESTSVMMRNLPNNYSRKMLLELMEAEGYGGSFDFVYLPVDFHSNSGLGYAFINLISSDVAGRFCKHFTGFKNWNMASDKVCQVAWSDTLQGFSAHVERYRNSPVMHDSVPEDHRPLLFAGREQVPFPPPTKNIRAPRRWHRRH